MPWRALSLRAIGRVRACLLTYHFCLPSAAAVVSGQKRASPRLTCPTDRALLLVLVPAVRLGRAAALQLSARPGSQRYELASASLGMYC